MEQFESVFRKHPELDPTGKLSIMGTSSCNAERMNAYVRRRNPQAPEVAEAFLRLGEQYGVRGDVAYCQLAYETNGWTTDLAGPAWSPVSLVQGVTEEIIETRMRILYLFASEQSLPVAGIEAAGKHVAVLERAGWRGKVRCWEDLSGKWPGRGRLLYGQDVVAMWRSMLTWRGRGEVMMDEQSDKRSGHSAADPAKGRVTGGGLDWSSVSTEEMRWLQGLRLLPNPAPHPDRKVTWAELAELLHQWEIRPSADTMERNQVLLKKEG
ncbi:glucosaminidase domain-containing protein [Cohnella endophytica]|nr:glucosaminidase domain-containing protein [Cohnella endophytica]